MSYHLRLNLKYRVMIVAVFVFCAMIIAGCLSASGQEPEADAPIIIAPAESYKLSCRTATTPNGVKDECTLGPITEQVCPTGQIQICMRKYGTRTCDCYPE